MPPDLKDRLANAAELNGRSLNAEIVQRLEASFELRPPMTNGIGFYGERGNGTVELSDHDKAILSVFRRLPVEKQLALISLFK